MTLILSLCDYSGAWSRPYALAGYRVIRVDTGHPPGVSIADDGAILIGADVRTWTPPERPYAVLAAPPCTCFCRPAALRWPGQDASGRTAESLDIVRACLAIAKTDRLSSGDRARSETPPGFAQAFFNANR